MSDNAYNKLVRFALDEPDSRFCIFMKRVAGYRFFEIGNPICTPKYILYQRLIKYPHQLELLEQGLHPDYKRVYKEDFDNIKAITWEQEH